MTVNDRIGSTNMIIIVGPLIGPAPNCWCCEVRTFRDLSTGVTDRYLA